MLWPWRSSRSRYDLYLPRLYVVQHAEVVIVFSPNCSKCYLASESNWDVQGQGATIVVIQSTSS